MKLATPIGALSGKSVQVILPAVVLMIAVGCNGAGFAAVDEEEDAACAAAKLAIRIIPTGINTLRMDAPEQCA
jgi:hypothetical protein